VSSSGPSYNHFDCLIFLSVLVDQNWKEHTDICRSVSKDVHRIGSLALRHFRFTELPTYIPATGNK